MACKNICRLCDRLILSNSVVFNSAGNLEINIPAGAYNNNEKYCIVIAQTIPSTTPINAPVIISIGEGTVSYPLTSCDCRQITAQSLRNRTKYSTKVVTNATGGTFRLLGEICNMPNNNLRSIDGTTPT